MTKRLILLVEDNPDDEALAMRALHRGRLDPYVHVVRDGAEAIDFLFGTGSYANRDDSETPAVVLLDIKLPKVDGLEVLRRLRAAEHTKFTPVVILTSSREDQDILNGYRLGANSYITKPLDYEEFMKTVQQLGLYWFHLNEPMPDIGRN